MISNRWRSQFNLINDELKGGVTRIPGQCLKNNPLQRPQTKESKAICNDRLTLVQGKLTMKVVFETYNEQNLMTAKNLKAICRLENKIIRSFPSFVHHCHRDNKTGNCCPSWSVGNYIAALRGKGSCFEINETDVTKISGLLQKCSKYYHSGALTGDCWDFAKNKKAMGQCRNVEKACTRYNIVYNILHYLTDKNFLSQGTNSSPFLRYSLVLVPTDAEESFQVDVYKSILAHKVSDGDVVLTGFEFSELKFAIFNERLLGDLYLAAAAMLFIVTILWVYTRSLLITSLVGLIVVSALIIAYFIYTVVLGLKFFPFLNILTLVFLVGIGADDAFVYMDVWNQATREHRDQRTCSTTDDDTTHDLISITADTMKHASLSMFVTSFTTASAFFASLTSEITSIRLFGLYSGIAILCTLLLMVTWFPAAVIIDQTLLSRYSSCATKLKNVLFKSSNGSQKILARLIKFHQSFFNDFLPALVIKLRYFWVAFFFILAAGGIVVATYWPGLQLPSSKDFQMFHESHVLEKYSLRLKKNFHFETSMVESRFPINLIWGIKAMDNGDQFNPDDPGFLTWDEGFDMTTSQAQIWILKLINHLKKQPFFAKDQKQLSEKCFIEEFFTRMRMNCTEENKPCCRDSSFPYTSSVFSKCLLQMQCDSISEFQHSSHSITDGAPLFDANGTLRAISLKFESAVPFSWSYDPADHFWKQTENWATSEFVEAPESANGWFISQLKYYDLQRSLSKGTFYSMGISLAMAFSVMLLMTRNIFISVFAILTIIGALGVTVGSLVLMGWKLNILESITLSVAVGLSIDFALHYGIAYVLASDKTARWSRVTFSVSRMGSAITMAAFTTFITG